MNRNSERAKRLAERTGASPRQLEAWSSQPKKASPFLFLGSDDRHDGDAALAAALLEVGTQGRDRESTALVVASRFGLAVADYKTALLRKLHLDDPTFGDLTAPLDVDERGDLTEAGAVEAELRAGSVEMTDDLGRTMQRRIVESSAAFGETPEEMWHSFATLLVALTSGTTGYFTSSVAAVLGLDPSDVVRLSSSGHPYPVSSDAGGVMADSLERMSFSMARVRQIIEEVPPADLARSAPALRPISRVLTAVVARQPYDPNSDELSACLVPFVLAAGADALDRFVAVGKNLAAALEQLDSSSLSAPPISLPEEPT